MAFAKLLVVVFLLVCVISQSRCQINFSPTWGTGKRSMPLFEQQRSCLGKSDMRILYNLVKIIQKESELMISCLNGEDELMKQQ